VGQITVSSAWNALVQGNSVDANGTPQASTATIMANLGKVAGGDFSQFSGGTMLQINAPFVGPGERNVSQMCQDMITVINKDFGGQPGPAAAFLKTIAGNKSIGDMNFHELVANGTADRLATMQKTNMLGFAHIMAGSFGNATALTAAINQTPAGPAGAAQAPLSASTTAAPRPPNPAPSRRPSPS
jgi:hypothetical protein